MTENYDPNHPEQVIPPEVVEDDPTKPYKALVPALIAAVLAAIGFAVADVDPFTWKDGLQTFGVGLSAGAAIGIPTYFTPNPKVVRHV